MPPSMPLRLVRSNEKSSNEQPDGCIEPGKIYRRNPIAYHGRFVHCEIVESAKVTRPKHRSRFPCDVVHH